ncbi:hypothetical protein ALC53_03137 [Atta colombica]|uniref:Uncharacterized protein n=1 Tax=Atta colombica TaxID=520822 RepID=A0A195BQ50_9HYME|nr:hypothetical protein ALC53_03137 [Atta colombica]
MRNTLLQPEYGVQVPVCVCITLTDSSFARECRAKPSQSPYLPEMIRFESVVSHDNRTHSTGRLRADVGEKILHRGPPEASLLSRFWICGTETRVRMCIIRLRTRSFVTIQVPG